LSNVGVVRASVIGRAPVPSWADGWCAVPGLLATATPATLELSKG
jgi:hypothetical protein